MNQRKAQNIMQATQGLCGIIEVLAENRLNRDRLSNGHDVELLKPFVEGHLLTAAQQLSFQLNGFTENLNDYDFVKRENI